MGRSHQTVRLAAGRHRSSSAGACVMELASMLAGEPFSDRARSVSPLIGAFLRTYNDGIDEERRQDLYPIAALVVGTAADRATEDERMSRMLRFAQRLGTPPPRGRAAVALATPEAAGASAAIAALRANAHEEALQLVRELAALRLPPRFPILRRLLGHDPADAVDLAVRSWRPPDATQHHEPDRSAFLA